MMSLWDALRMNMMISYQELVRTFPSMRISKKDESVNYELNNFKFSYLAVLCILFSGYQ
ncbi:hypothetical protein KLQUCK414M1_14855 [Klebsiella quasipneumoniae subsp. similipneumoniae]